MLLIFVCFLFSILYLKKSMGWDQIDGWGSSRRTAGAHSYNLGPFPESQNPWPASCLLPIFVVRDN
jgi:hypothetical protein